MFRSTALIIVCSMGLLACGGQENDSKATKIAPPKVTPQETAEPNDIYSSETVSATVAEDNYGSEADLDDIEATTIAISEEEMPEALDIEEDGAGEVAAVTDSDEQEQTATNESIVYTVQAGDVLSAIARAHNTTVDAIVMTNALSNPNSIAVGQKLLIE